MSNNNPDRDFAPINLDAGERISSSSARRSQPQTIVKSNNVLVSLLMLLSLLASAGAGYLYLELEKANIVISTNNERLDSLESRLSAAGEELDSSTATLQIRVGELLEKTDLNFSEVDKLWAARNSLRKQVNDITKDVNGFKSDTTRLVNESKSELADAETARQQLVGRLESLNSKLNEQANSILATNVEREALAESTQQANNQIRDLNEKIILLERRNTNLLQQINDLEKQLQELANKSV